MQRQNIVKTTPKLVLIPATEYRIFTNHLLSVTQIVIIQYLVLICLTSLTFYPSIPKIFLSYSVIL